MTQTIIPLRPRDGRESSFVRIDTVASRILIEGRAMDLRAARIEAILMDLRVQRDRMAMVLADLRGQEPTGHRRVEAADAGLISTIEEGLAQIDLFITRAGLIDQGTAKSPRIRSDISAQPLLDV